MVGTRSEVGASQEPGFFEKPGFFLRDDLFRGTRIPDNFRDSLLTWKFGSLS